MRDPIVPVAWRLKTTKGLGQLKKVMKRKDEDNGATPNHHVFDVVGILRKRTVKDLLYSRIFGDRDPDCGLHQPGRK